MAGIAECRLNTGGNVERLAIDRSPAEEFETVEGVELRVQRLQRRSTGAMTRGPAAAVARLFLLKVGGIEQYQPDELARRRGRYDFTAKTSFRQQRQTSAMIEVGMRQQHIIDCRGIKTEGTGVFLRKFVATLVQAAIDQDTAAVAFDQVT